MLEPPDLTGEMIRAWLRDEYGLRATEIVFLPLGADMNTAVYRVENADDAVGYFLKLRRGAFHAAGVVIPRLLHARGIATVIAPIPTRAGALWVSTGEWNVMLYPHVGGRDGYAAALGDTQCIEFGKALNAIHATPVPALLDIPRETFAPQYRERVREFQALVEVTRPADPVAAAMAAIMRDRQVLIADLVARAEQLAHRVQQRGLEYAMCHGDLHAGNLLIAPDGEFYIVDWDTLVLAPKERDLMYIGAGLGVCDTARQQRLFYRGYGDVAVDMLALTYYRYERIVEDIAAFGEQLLASDAGGADRAQSLEYFTSSFLPDHVIDIAYQTDRSED